jgi:hypothetical protein
MTLVEDGRLRLNDPVALHIPGFARYGKNAITIRHLLTHVSGLRPDVDLHPWTGYDAAIELAMDEIPTAAPGAVFVYSDINFFLLSVSETGGVRTARHAGHRLQSTQVAAAAHRADGTLRRTGCLAVQTA